MHAHIENFTRFTPLGIKFWDPVQDKAIEQDLEVTAWPANNPGSKVHAFKTYSGAFSFRNLPGLIDLELSGGTGIEDSPPELRQYIVSVSDRQNRYLDVSFSVSLPLPYKGLFLAQQPSSPVSETPKGFYLYSSITRHVSWQYAEIRGELTDVTTGEVASHALVRALTDDNETWFGISDSQGRFLLVLPYPGLPDGFGGSPIVGQVPLHLQSWIVELAVGYQPDALIGLKGTDIPSYVTILSQKSASIFSTNPDVSGSAASSLPLTINFNQATIARTDGFSSLYINPSAA